MKKSLFLLITILVLSCHQNSKINQTENAELKSGNVENFDWLNGKWKRLNEEAGKETFEHWDKISENEYSGIGFTIQKGDTIKQEKLDLIKTDGKWSLIVKVPVEKESISFAMSEIKSNEFTCINDSIDFPKKIKYWSEGEMLKAKISNDEIGISFEFKKNR